MQSHNTSSALTSRIVNPSTFGKRVYNRIQRKMKEWKYNTVEFQPPSDINVRDEFQKFKTGHYPQITSAMNENMHKFAQYEYTTNSQNKIRPGNFNFSHLYSSTYVRWQS